LFWAEDGGFWERSKNAHEVGVLRYREKPFELNADCARTLNDLSLATGDRGLRALAERTLAMLSPQAGRYGVAGAMYAIAVEEYFEAPIRVVIVGDAHAGSALRATALRLPIPNRQVWAMPEGGRIGPLQFPAQANPAAYVATARGVSPAVTHPEKLPEVLLTLR
jgi:uncharacterized protein YyaL (SSP411 family)